MVPINKRLVLVGLDELGDQIWEEMDHGDESI
jgi:hypothetical protein